MDIPGTLLPTELSDFNFHPLLQVGTIIHILYLIRDQTFANLDIYDIDIIFMIWQIWSIIQRIKNDYIVVVWKV